MHTCEYFNVLEYQNECEFCYTYMYFITYVSYIIFSAGNQTQGLVHDRQVLHHSLMFPDLGL